MKKVFILMVLLSAFSLTGCLKDAAKSVGDVGNSAGKAVDDTVNRENTK